jgi:hypothetical protein
MELHIVEQDDVACDQFGDQKMLNKKIKDLSIDRPFDRHRRANSAQARGANHRCIRPVMTWFADLSLLASM